MLKKMAYVMVLFIASFLVSFIVLQADIPAWQALVILSILVACSFGLIYYFWDKIEGSKTLVKILETLEFISNSIQHQLPEVNYKITHSDLPDNIWHIEFSNGARSVDVRIRALNHIGVLVIPEHNNTVLVQYFTTKEEVVTKAVQLLKKVA